MNQAKSNGTQAVVMGASLGGLITARVLSAYFDKVILVEKDEVQRRPESRKGQLHTRHSHGLLPAGLDVMTRFFPDLQQALAENGANMFDFGDSMLWQTYGGYRQPMKSNLTVAIVSRPMLEHLIRERVLALPNVRLMDQTAVKNLILSADNQTVTGIETESKADGGSTIWSADLVVDTTGRGSRSPKWLNEAGFGEVPVSEVKVNVSYTTRIYQRDTKAPYSQKWVFYTPEAPKETCFAALLPIEGDRWTLTLGGWHGENAPQDDDAYLAYIKNIGMPELYDIISNSVPLSEIMIYKVPTSLRRHYEKLNRFPKGYLVLGDAVASFNPTYGQGMTSASMQALELDKLLADHTPPARLAKKFFKKAAKVIDTPWTLAVGEDFRYPQTEGPKPFATDFINKYVGRVHRATLTDKVVCEAFLKVMSLLKPPSSLFHPSILWRVMR